LSGVKLSSLSVVLGAVLSVPQIYAFINPGKWRELIAKFPRSKPIGYVLMGIATLWFLLHVQHETLADFTKWKPHLMIGFAAIGVLTCVYVSDFLAARGLALLLLLVAKLMVDTARWHPSPWRWVISGLAYVWVIAGIWFTISPWRLRNLLNWSTRTDARLRLLSGIGLGLAALLVVLGLTVYRAG
jgi:hypothetical protein